MQIVVSEVLHICDDFFAYSDCSCSETKKPKIFRRTNFENTNILTQIKAHTK